QQSLSVAIPRTSAAASSPSSASSSNNRQEPFQPVTASISPTELNRMRQDLSQLEQYLAWLQLQEKIYANLMSVAREHDRHQQATEQHACLRSVQAQIELKKSEREELKRRIDEMEQRTSDSAQNVAVPSTSAANDVQQQQIHQPHAAPAQHVSVTLSRKPPDWVLMLAMGQL
ncbi:hypothetical protein PMAYCL1PPCAC_10219, partial [Pristionchus mayeri]